MLAMRTLHYKDNLISTLTATWGLYVYIKCVGREIFVWGIIFWYLCGSYSVLGLVSGAERWHTPTGYHIEIGF